MRTLSVRDMQLGISPRDEEFECAGLKLSEGTYVMRESLAGEVETCVFTQGKVLPQEVAQKSKKGDVPE